MLGLNNLQWQVLTLQKALYRLKSAVVRGPEIDCK
jgi:hypothetical protein